MLITRRSLREEKLKRSLLCTFKKTGVNFTSSVADMMELEEDKEYFISFEFDPVNKRLYFYTDGNVEGFKVSFKRNKKKRFNSNYKSFNINTGFLFAFLKNKIEQLNLDEAYYIRKEEGTNRYEVLLDSK